MKVDVYQTKKEDTYLFLVQGEPFSSVPQAVRDTVGIRDFFDTMEFTPSRANAKPSEILMDLEKQQYSVHRAKFRITGHG